LSGQFFNELAYRQSPVPSGPPLPTGAGVLAQLGPGKVAVDHLSNGTFPQRQAKQRFHH
jgi:hypothetical protein